MQALLHQVRIEFEASFQYILMAAHFDQVFVSHSSTKRLVTFGILKGLCQPTQRCEIVLDPR